MSNPRITLAQISAKLGVSVSTVSRALRNAPGVDSETRNRILAAARQARPGNLGKGAATPRTILALCRDKAFAWDGGILAGLSRAAVEMDMSVVLHQVGGSDFDCLAMLEEPPAALRSGRVHGIVLLHSFPEILSRELSTRCPLVNVLATGEVIGDCVGVDLRHGLSGILGENPSSLRPACIVSASSPYSLGEWRTALNELCETKGGVPSGENVFAPEDLHEAESRRHDVWIFSDQAAWRQAPLWLREAGLRTVMFFCGPEVRRQTDPSPAIESCAEDIGREAVRLVVSRMEHPRAAVRCVMLRPASHRLPVPPGGALSRIPGHPFALRP